MTRGFCIANVQLFIQGSYYVNLRRILGAYLRKDIEERLLWTIVTGMIENCYVNWQDWKIIRIDVVSKTWSMLKINPLNFHKNRKEIITYTSTIFAFDMIIGSIHRIVAEQNR